MRRLTKILLTAACALIGSGCTQVKSESDAAAAAAARASVNSGADAARMDAKWVSAIVGMKVVTPAGALLGRVQDVAVGGYGRAGFAIVSYGGVMGAGTRYTAVPWATVAESAKPELGDKDWRRAAESYWNGKAVAAQ